MGLIRRALFIAAMLVATYIAPVFATTTTGLPSPTYTANITTATTTLVATATQGPLYFFYMGVVASGAEASSTYQFETGKETTTPCDTNTLVLSPVAQPLPATTGNATSFFSASAVSNGTLTISPTATPFYLPNGTQLCLVTAGTTIAAYGLVWFTS